MPRAREVRDCFEDILQKNNQTLSELNATLIEISAQKAAAEESYVRDVQIFVDGLLADANPAVLAKLSTAVGGEDYVAFYDKSKRKSADAAQYVGQLVQSHGAPEAVKDHITTLKEELQKLNAQKDTANQILAALNTDLKEIDAFNKAYEDQKKPLLNSDNVDYFTAKKGLSNAWSWLTDTHYRQGRQALLRLPHPQTDLGKKYQERTETTKSLEPLQENIRTKERALYEKTSALNSMEKSAADITNDAEIIGGIQQHVLESLANREVFVSVVKHFSATVPAAVVEARGKIENYTRMEATLQRRTNTVRQASAKIEAPMLKLQKAVKKNSKKDIPVDLRDIRGKFDALNKESKHEAAEIKKMGEAVKKYKLKPLPQPQPSSQPSSSFGPLHPAFDVLDIFTHVMIWDMLTHDCTRGLGALSLDKSVLSSTLGVPDAKMLDGLGFDTLSAGDAGILNDFNTSALDAFSDVSVPDIAVPDITIPDIPDFSFELPDFHFPDFDFPDIDFPDF